MFKSKALKNLKEKFFSKRPKTFSFSPDKDWRILIIVFIILNIVSTGYFLIVFLNLKNGKSFQISSDLNQEIIFIDKNKLDETLSRYEEKIDRSTAILDGEISVSDISE